MKTTRCADEFGQNTKSGKATFTLDQVKDVVTLINNREWPDMNFSADECRLWSMLRRELKVSY